MAGTAKSSGKTAMAMTRFRRIGKRMLQDLRLRRVLISAAAAAYHTSQSGEAVIIVITIAAG